METNIKELEGCKREFEAVLGYDELTPYFDKAIEKYREKAVIPGFRKGKAPISMIKKRFGESIEYTSLEDIANEVFSKYMMDNDVDMIGHGKMTDLDYLPKEKFTFKVEFEVKPEVKLENYKGFDLTKKKYVIDDSLVDEEVNYHKLNNAELAMDAEALDDDYVVTADVQTLDDAGNIIIGQGQKDVKLYLGNKDLLPEFKSALEGIKEGEDRIVNTKTKDGNPQKVKLSATKVEKMIYPEMNEEFFKKITGKEDVKTEEEFREAIRGELAKIYNDHGEQHLRNDLISEVVKNNDITIPDTFTEAILKSILEDYKKQLPKNYELTPEQLDEFNKSRKADAIFQAKWFLIREKLAEMENITAEDSDYMELAEENSARFNIPADKLVEVYKENNDIRSSIISRKVLDFLEKNSNITEEEEVKKFEPHTHQHEH
ncbi:MAG: trigger factor [Ignavibacteriae bacterium]|nr:trigger factor [Ignavibacteriota bacterium]MCB9243531.1 trigger factor [Ignavibacteriales bacterium]